MAAAEMSKLTDDFEVLVVNDGSQDNTRLSWRSLSWNFPSFASSTMTATRDSAQR
jgi:hypothetical protein